MGVIGGIDAIVNFIPRIPERALDKMVRGPEALALLPFAGLGYLAGCALQGAAVGYVLLESGRTPTEALIGTTVTTCIPPVMKLVHLYTGR